MTGPLEFDPTVPLPAGVTVLEASAGTGKTHAVASLVVAEVAEGRPLDELLVVTFTRKATGTLRERLWLRLTEAARALAPDAAAPADSEDLLVHLRRGTPDEVAARRANLRRALADFDAATIATTHQFCQQVLASLGVAGDAERGLELVDGLGDLVADAVDDLFVRRFHAGGDVLFDRQTALAIAEAVVANPDCAIGPVDDNDADRLRQRFALTLRRRVDDQKRRGRVITYDDLLSRLDTSITDDARGRLVADRLRRRFTMAVVDEFQDTDAVQWRILHTAFGAPPSTLVLVGDPKQAIYAFRGGDVSAYLEATAHAGHRRSLPVSWRADQPLLDAQDALFAGAQFGDAAIRHRPLRARPGASSSGLHGPAVGAPLTVRIAGRDSGAFALTRTGWASKPSVRQFIAEDVAAEAVRILTAGTTIDGRDVAPGDLAVLTRTHREADAARDALHTVDVPAVVHGGSSVFATDAGQDWIVLLQALEQPASAIRVRNAAVGPFIGWDAARVATATDADWEHLDIRLREWAAALQTRSVAAVLRGVESATGLTARLLTSVGGERRLSDLQHVAELLHGWQSSHPSSIAVLIGWLGEQVADAGHRGAEEDGRRRLESDAAAVAVHTVHGAKGLEFPIVLLPSLWDAPRSDDADVPVFHDDGGRRVIGVGGSGPHHDEQVRRAAEDRDHEELRLLYVALTRARHQVVAWWTAAHDADVAAFARLLCGHDETTGAVARRLRRRPDEALVAAELTRRTIAVEVARGATGVRYRRAPERAGTLSVSRFDRRFDRQWVRTSYSGLTAAA
ncbi:MAG: UvrD-helicase domain-containing protein, partial [Ilumatobacteraceae bacterium]